jgi:hypothetical protein
MKKTFLFIALSFTINLFAQDTRLFLEYNFVSVEHSNGDRKEGWGTNSFILDIFSNKDIVHVNDRGNVIKYKMLSNTLFEMKSDSSGTRYREATIVDDYGTKIYLVLLNDGEQVMFLFFPDFTIIFEIRK